MKKPIYLLLCSILCLAPITLHAAFSVNLDAGELTGYNGATMPSDNTLGSANGSLLLLVDLGGPNDTVSNTLNPGNFVSGNDFVLAAGGFNTNGGTNETNTAFASAAGTSGDEIALRWFPQITYAQYLLGVTPTAGEYFGTYNPSGGAPDGGDNWTVPSSGLINLDFFTANSDGGGNEAASAGYANFQVAGTAAVPEPSTYALLGFGFAALVFIVRRRNNNSND